MAFNQLSCGSNFGNTGVPNCAEDFGMVRKLILVPQGVEFATAAAAIVQANWTTNINKAIGDRWFPYPIIADLEDLSEEAQYQELAAASIFLRDGKKIARYTLDKIAFGLHKKLRTHNSGRWSVYKVTDNGYILGRTIDGTKFLPFPLTTHHVEKQNDVMPDSTNLTKVYQVFQNDDDWDTNGAWVKPTAFDPVADLNGILDVELYSVTAATTGITFGVRGYWDAQEITGLVYADLTLHATIVSEDNGTLTDNGNGTYTLTPTSSFTTGDRTIALKNQPSMTTKGYEAVATLSITVA